MKMLERVQKKAARFIANDYRSKTPGFVTGILEEEDLIPLEERRRQLRLGFLYKIIEKKLPSMPPEEFITAQKPTRRIRATRKDNFLMNNPIQKYERNNDRCLVIPRSNTLQWEVCVTVHAKLN